MRSSMLATTLASRELNVSVYAFSRPEKDHYGIVLVNMGAEAKTISLSGPWEGSHNLSAWVHTFTGGSSSKAYMAQNFKFDGLNGPSKGGPFPFDEPSPQTVPFKGSVTLHGASITGLVIAPSSAPPPTPTPPPPPTPPVPMPRCCHNDCSAVKCDDPASWCGQSKSNCVARCRGSWCPPQGGILV